MFTSNQMFCISINVHTCKTGMWKKSWLQIMKAKVPGCTYRRVTCTHAQTCGSALEVFIASVLEILATTTGDALERKVVTSSLSLPWAAAPMIRWISTWFHCSFHLLSMVFFSRPQCIFNECAPCCLDSRALRSSRRSLQMETACHHLCFQIFHITNKTHG